MKTTKKPFTSPREKGGANSFASPSNDVEANRRRSRGFTIISLGGSVIVPNEIDVSFLADFRKLIKN
jgi:hypothetical protein